MAISLSPAHSRPPLWFGPGANLTGSRAFSNLLIQSVCNRLTVRMGRLLQLRERSPPATIPSARFQNNRNLNRQAEFLDQSAKSLGLQSAGKTGYRFLMVPENLRPSSNSR